MSKSVSKETNFLMFSPEFFKINFNNFILTWHFCYDYKGKKVKNKININLYKIYTKIKNTIFSQFNIYLNSNKINYFLKKLPPKNGLFVLKLPQTKKKVIKYFSHNTSISPRIAFNFSRQEKKQSTVNKTLFRKSKLKKSLKFRQNKNFLKKFKQKPKLNFKLKQKPKLNFKSQQKIKLNFKIKQKSILRFKYKAKMRAIKKLHYKNIKKKIFKNDYFKYLYGYNKQIKLLRNKLLAIKKKKQINFILKLLKIRYFFESSLNYAFKATTYIYFINVYNFFFKNKMLRNELIVLVSGHYFTRFVSSLPKLILILYACTFFNIEMIKNYIIDELQEETHQNKHWFILNQITNILSRFKNFRKVFAIKLGLFGTIGNHGRKKKYYFQRGVFTAHAFENKIFYTMAHMTTKFGVICLKLWIRLT
jgi:hypothetical protein